MRSTSLPLVVAVALLSIAPRASADAATGPSRPFGPVQPDVLLAQSGGDGTVETGTEMELRRRLAELEAQRDAIRMGPTTAMMIVGGVSTGVGVVLLVVTALACGTPFSDCGDTSNDNVLYGVGGAAIGVGTVTFAVGALEARDRTRRRIEVGREIMEIHRRLEEARAPGLSLNVAPGGRPGLGLSVAF